MIMNYKRLWRDGHAPLYISGAVVKRVKGMKPFGVHLTNDLTCSIYTKTVVQSWPLAVGLEVWSPHDILTNFLQTHQ